MSLCCLAPEKNGISAISCSLHTFPAKTLHYGNPWENWQFPETEQRPEACTYTQPCLQAFKQMIWQTKLSSAWINSKVRFDFQKFLHIQAQLQPIYSPVFQCVSLSINNHSRLQDWSLHLIGNKKTPQFWLGFSLWLCVEALTQLRSHHLLFPALQLFRPMKPCYNIKNRALHM